MEVDNAADSESDEDKMDFETSNGSPEPCSTPSQVTSAQRLAQAWNVLITQ